MNRSSSGIVSLIGLNALLTWSTGRAESAVAPDNSLQEIVVTAQRREESLSKTPVSVAVVSADELAKNQVLTEQDLRFAAPGLTVRATINSNQLGFALRGQSQDAYSNARPAVLPYFNEVQISSSGQGAGSTALYDLQSVQVLKGPQGTLFGRSATAGAVLYTTAKPTDQVEGYVSALGGDYGEQKYEGAVGGPLVAGILDGRVSGYFQKRDGFQNNLYDGSNTGGVERAGARLSLTAFFGENARNELVGDFLHSTGQNTVGVISGLTPFTGGTQAPYLPIALLYSGTSTPVATATGEAVLAGFVPPAFAAAVPGQYQSYFANPRHPSTGLTAYLALQQSEGPYTVNSDSANGYAAKDAIVSDTTTIGLSDRVQLKNIFGYIKKSSSNETDGDGTPYTIVSGTGYDIGTRGVSDEIQLQGNLLDPKLVYVTGLYASNESETQFLHTSFFDLVFGGEKQTNAFTITHKTLGPYAESTYQINDSGLAVTLGARYTHERIGFIQLPEDSGRMALGETPPPDVAYVQGTSYNNVNWHIGLEDQIDANWLAYIASRRAFRNGGYNGTVPPVIGFGDTGGNAFKAERVTDVELGTKFLGSFGGLPVRLDIAIYNVWDDNAPHRDFDLVGASPSSLTVNVPYTNIYGVEFDAQIKPISALTTGVTFAYTRARFGSAPVYVFGQPQVFNQVPDTPKTIASLYADYSIPVAADYAVTLHGDVYNQSKTYADSRSINNDGTIVAAYTIANFRVALENTRERWTFQANVKNAFNRVYYVGALPTGVIYQVNTAIPGEPRTFTVEARYKF